MKKIHFVLIALLSLPTMMKAQDTFYWYYDDVNKEAYVMNHERWHEHRVNGDSWTTYYGGCHSYSGDVVVPETAPNGYPVVGIYKSAFENCNNHARGIYPLTSVTLPATLRTIGDRAFFGCSFLTEVVIPEGVESIGNQAFQECAHAATLRIPSTLKLIDQNAFYENTSLLHLTIPASVDSIGYAAFMRLDTLQTLTIEDGPTPLHFDNGRGYGGEGMFGYDHHPYLKEAYIGRNTTTPYSGLFGSNKNIRKVTFGDQVTSIRHDDFRYCDSLHTVTFGKGLKEIGNWAFEDCDSLQAIDLPDAVETIGIGVFEDCVGATRLHIPTSLKVIEQSAFRNIDGVTELVIPANIDSVAYAAFMDMDGLKKVIIKDGETTLHFANGRDYGGEAMFAFAHQPQLEEAYVGRNYTSNPLFTGNKTLRKVTLNNVPNVTIATFSDCTGLEEATLGIATKSLARQAFYNCQSLTKLTVLATEPPACLDTNYWLFNNVDQQQCQLVVPEASVEAYKAHDVWKNFFNIEGTGIAQTRIDDATTNSQWYDLGGRRLSAPQRGVNIVRTADGRTQKVVVR